MMKYIRLDNQRHFLMGQLYNQRLFALIFSSMVLLYFVFLPATNLLYYAGDDFRYAFGGFTKACKTDDSFEFMWTLGRPLQAYLDCLTYKFAYTLERMRDVRLLSVILLGCGMGLLADCLCCLGLSIGIAFFASGVFFLIPEMYHDAVLTGSQPLAFSIILVLLSYRSAQQQPKLSALYLLCALLTYPAMAFFFVTLILAKLLFSSLKDWMETRRDIARGVVLFGIVCVVYYFFAFINMRYFPQAPVTDRAYQLNHPNFNIMEMLGRAAIMGNVFDRIWALSPLSNMAWQGWIMVMLLFSAIILTPIYFVNSQFYIRNQSVALVWALQAVASAIILVILCSAFTLVMPGRVWEARLLVGVISAGLMLMLWSINQCSFMLPSYLRTNIVLAAVTFFFLVQGYQTNVAMMVYAMSYQQYLNFTKTAIASYLATGSKLRRIHYIVPQTSYPYNQFFLSNGALMQLQ